MIVIGAAAMTMIVVAVVVTMTAAAIEEATSVSMTVKVTAMEARVEVVELMAGGGPAVVTAVIVSRVATLDPFVIVVMDHVTVTVTVTVDAANSPGI